MDFFCTKNEWFCDKQMHFKTNPVSLVASHRKSKKIFNLARHSKNRSQVRYIMTAVWSLLWLRGEAQPWHERLYSPGCHGRTPTGSNPPHPSRMPQISSSHGALQELLQFLWLIIEQKQNALPFFLSSPAELSGRTEWEWNLWRDLQPVEMLQHQDSVTMWRTSLA